MGPLSGGPDGHKCVTETSREREMNLPAGACIPGSLKLMCKFRQVWQATINPGFMQMLLNMAMRVLIVCFENVRAQPAEQKCSL